MKIATWNIQSNQGNPRDRLYQLMEHAVEQKYDLVMFQEVNLGLMDELGDGTITFPNWSFRTFREQINDRGLAYVFGSSDTTLTATTDPKYFSQSTFFNTPENSRPPVFMEYSYNTVGLADDIPVTVFNWHNLHGYDANPMIKKLEEALTDSINANEHNDSLLVLGGDFNVTSFAGVDAGGRRTGILFKKAFGKISIPKGYDHLLTGRGNGEEKVTIDRIDSHTLNPWGRDIDHFPLAGEVDELELMELFLA